MYPSTATAELDTVDNEVVVVRFRLKRVRQQQVDVLGRFWRCERVVCSGEPSAATLSGISVVIGREKGKVDNPKEVMAWIGIDKICGNSGFVHSGAESTGCGGTTSEMIG